jgi:hypothetical protein
LHSSEVGIVTSVIMRCHPPQLGSGQPHTVVRTGWLVNPSRFCMAFVRSWLLMRSTNAPSSKIFRPSNLLPCNCCERSAGLCQPSAHGRNLPVATDSSAPRSSHTIFLVLLTFPSGFLPPKYNRKEAYAGYLTDIFPLRP